MNQLVTLLNQPVIFVLFFVWSIFWKGLALWKAAGKKQFWWFVIILIINTFALLEIAYIFFLNRWDIDHGKTIAFIQKYLKNKKK